MNFNTSPLFDKQIKKLSKKYQNIKSDLIYFLNSFDDNHQIATTIKANLFKVRVKNSDKSCGKRGGYRIYYYLIDKNQTTHLLVIYDKSEIEKIDESILEDSLLDLTSIVETGRKHQTYAKINFT